MNWLFTLCVVVAVAATAEDLWRRRVSNVTTLGALVAGVTAHSVLSGWSGAWNSLLGALIGFLAFLIFFVLGGMGGGDIKLMAGFGAIVGMEHILAAVVLTGLAGGVMALVFLAVRKLRRLAKRTSRGQPEMPDRKAMIPYAPAISLGMLLTSVQFLE